MTMRTHRGQPRADGDDGAMLVAPPSWWWKKGTDSARESHNQRAGRQSW